MDGATVKAALPDKFTSELEAEAQEILQLPIVGLKRLRKFAGRSSWAAGVAPEVRSFLAPLWIVMGNTAKALETGGNVIRLRGEPAVATSRIRTALVWVRAFMQRRVGLGQLCRTVQVHSVYSRPRYTLTTDASPWGLGS